MTSPLQFAFIFGTALLPALVWLIFFLKEDIHPEPKRLVFSTFLVGVFITLPVLFVQIHFQQLIASVLWTTFFSVVGLALIEEVFKFFAAFGAIHNDPRFDEPVDAMIYSIAAALGFATVENIFVALNSVDGSEAFSFPSVLQTVLLRFIGATLLHALSSSMVGYFWAKGLIRKQLTSQIIIGLACATVIHAVFNFLILHYQDSNLFYPTFFLVIAAFFVLNDFEKLKELPIKKLRVV